MTETQFNEIKGKLSKWRKDRHLTYENQKAGFLGNVFEELSEYFRAKDDLERVDALCDMVIFCFNSFNLDYKTLEKQNDYDVTKISIVDITDYLDCMVASFYKNKLDNFNFIYKIIFNYLNLVKNLGFDFHKCMLEKIKEIENRTGFYDERLNKFTKDKGAYNTEDAFNRFLKENISDDFYILEDNEEFVIFDKENDFALDKFKKWYKADYESCRI
ncbi:hypothetical protein [Campylobacter coli]|uniref:hypothetical protein n=1 Tax=Campylobacter coli TaxID=195 RepID=UPI00119CB6BD|nr:hypothetical protein [Campylobacter coli]